jgi:hypothetical protein
MFAAGVVENPKMNVDAGHSIRDCCAPVIYSGTSLPPAGRIRVSHRGGHIAAKVIRPAGTDFPSIPLLSRKGGTLIFHLFLSLSLTFRGKQEIKCDKC